MAEAYKVDKSSNKCEIEITPQMIEAGIEQTCDYDSRFEDWESLVTRVFRAMAARAVKTLRTRP